MEKHLLTEENLLGMMQSFREPVLLYREEVEKGDGRSWKKKKTRPTSRTPKVGGSITGRNALFRTHGMRMFPGLYYSTTLSSSTLPRLRRFHGQGS